MFTTTMAAAHETWDKPEPLESPVQAQSHEYCYNVAIYKYQMNCSRAILWGIRQKFIRLFYPVGPIYQTVLLSYK